MLGTAEPNAVETSIEKPYTTPISFKAVQRITTFLCLLVTEIKHFICISESPKALFL